MIEPKGVDSFPMPNRLKIMMASNNDWVVPATEDERRYFVLDVSDAKSGDRAYWHELHAALDGGEVAAFLDHLLKLDLSGFEIRDVPHTKGLNRQKLRGRRQRRRAFWLDCLREGAIFGDGDASWPEDILDAGAARRLPRPRARPRRTAPGHGREDGRAAAGTLGRLRLQAFPTVEGQHRGAPAEAVRPGALVDHRGAFLKAMNIDPAHYEWPDGGGHD